MLSWQDREPLSQTYGCFDRTYWAWKFTDFPGARFQEGVYTLAHLYTSPWTDNRLRGDARVLAWLRAGLQLWLTLWHLCLCSELGIQAVGLPLIRANALGA